MAYKDHEKALQYWREYNAKRRVPKPKTARQTALENGGTHYNTGKPCVNGHISPRRTKDRVCMECDAIYQKQARKNDPDKRSASSKATYKKHRAKVLAQKKEYRQANRGSIAALNAARKARVKQRTPGWLTVDHVWVVKEIYKLSELRTKMFGFQWHVDHIVPLQGEKVSGLHVPWNLQVIPWLDNVVKKNHHA